MTRDKRRDRQLNIDLWLIFKVQNRHFVFLVLVCLIFAPREIRKYAQKECIYKAKTAPCFFYIKKPAVYRPTINFYLGIDCYFFHAYFFFSFRPVVTSSSWQYNGNPSFPSVSHLGYPHCGTFLVQTYIGNASNFPRVPPLPFRRLLPSYTATACETEYFKKQFWVLIYKKYTTGSVALLKKRSILLLFYFFILLGTHVCIGYDISLRSVRSPDAKGSCKETALWVMPH